MCSSFVLVIKCQFLIVLFQPDLACVYKIVYRAAHKHGLTCYVVNVFRTSVAFLSKELVW